MGRRRLAGEVRYRELLERMPSGVVIYEAVEGGEDFIIREFNRAAERIEGVSREQVIAKRVSEAFPGVKALGLLSVFQRVWRTGVPEHHPASLYEDMRIVGWRENYVYKLPSGEVVAVYDDVTERKRAEEALRQERDLLQALMDNSPDDIYFKDTALRYTRVNPAAAARLGAANRNAAVGRTSADFFTEEHARNVRADDQRVLVSGEPIVDKVHAIRLADGESHWVSTTKVPLRGPDGAITGLAGITRDITARVRAEEEARSLVCFPAENPAPVLRVRADGTLLYANPAASTAFRECAAAAVGEPVPESWQQLVQVSLKTGVVQTADVHYDDRLYFFTAAPQPQSGYVNLYATDITERRRAEYQVLHLNSVLRAIRGVNQLITREPNRETLLQNACNSLTATRSYPSAWIGLLDQEGGAMRLFAGGLGEYAAALRERLALGKWPHCVSRTLGEPGVMVIENVETTCGDCEVVGRYEGAEAMATRLEYEGVVSGLMVVSTSREMFPSDDEQTLFHQVADDLAFALHAIRVGEERAVDEQALRESQERYRNLFEFLNDAAFLADAETGRILDANLQAEALLGRPRNEIVGMHQTQLHPPNKGPTYREHFASHVQKGRVVDNDAEVVRKDGTIVPVTISASTFTLAGRSLMLGLFHDLTEHKRLEAQFLQAQKMEAVGQLAGGIAHDFNNLLTVIVGYSELVLRQVPDQPDVAADVEEIKKAGERASLLTRQLLTFSRKQLWVPQVLDLNQTVGSFEKMLRRVISEDIRFDIVAAPSLGRMKADPGQIEQLLMNLVLNARDAMPRGGRLAITTANAVLDGEFTRRHLGAVPGRYVSLTVQDTGCGMTPDVLAHVFEPFFTTKGPSKGTGLGLSTVYGLVQQSGGYITVESTPGVGTTVTTYLPTVDDRVESTAAGPQSVQTLKGTETILLVEDEVGVRRLMRKVLERYGYTILEARDASDAMAIEESYSGAIHLLLSDIIMPGLSGPDLAQRIVRRRPAIKVLFVSGYASREAIALGMSSPHASFLQKPFRPEILAQQVRERLDGDGGQPGRTSTSV